MEIIKRIRQLVNKSISNGQYTLEDMSGILLNKSDWEEYVKYKNSVGESDYFVFNVPVKLTNSVGPSRCYFLHSRVKRSLGIIGTAGRGTDSGSLDIQTWKFMKASVGKLIEVTGCNHLISGGAAWADHLAVNLFLNNSEHLSLTLHLPCEFLNGKYIESSKCGPISNHYHKKFSDKLGIDSLQQIESAINLGCEKTVSNDSFFERNAKISVDSNILLAFTYGNEKELKDGGTKDTFEKFLHKKDRGIAFHINLNNQKIYIY